MNVHDVVSPFAFVMIVTFGYLIFAAAWILISYVVMRGLLDLVEFLDQLDHPISSKVPIRSRARSRVEVRSPKVLPFPVRVKVVMR